MNTRRVRRSPDIEQTRAGFRKLPGNMPVVDAISPKGPKVDILLPDNQKSRARYKVIEEIGHGGMATVYSAIDTETGRKVAVKISGGEKENTFMINEIQRLQELGDNDKTVKLLDYGREDGCWFAVLEYLGGKDLDYLCKKSGELIPWERTQTIVVQLCEGVEGIHEKGIIHRDLKPKNVMLRVSNGEEEVVVVDLGLATKDGFKEEDDGYVRGSPFYMAPEQLFNERLDGRTDVYAVGVILYKMLCGVLPFDGTSGAVMTQIIMDRPKPPSEQAKYLIIPGEVEAVAMKAIAKNPGDRFQDIGELKEALLQCRDGPRRIGEDQEPAGKTEPC